MVAVPEAKKEKKNRDQGVLIWEKSIILLVSLVLVLLYVVCLMLFNFIHKSQERGRDATQLNATHAILPVVIPRIQPFLFVKGTNT